MPRPELLVLMKKWRKAWLVVPIGTRETTVMYVSYGALDIDTLIEGTWRVLGTRSLPTMMETIQCSILGKEESRSTSQF